MQSDTTLVFVFGTLKEGFPNFATNRGRRVDGTFITRDALPLYLVGERRVPWMLLSPGQGLRVKGQVFEVDAQTLSAMDHLERIHDADGYRRVPLAVEGGTPWRAIEVQAYLKPAEQFTAELPRVGPFDEYTLEHAAQYRRRADGAG